MHPGAEMIRALSGLPFTIRYFGGFTLFHVCLLVLMLRTGDTDYYKILYLSLKLSHCYQANSAFSGLRLYL